MRTLTLAPPEAPGIQLVMQATLDTPLDYRPRSYVGMDGVERWYHSGLRQDGQIWQIDALMGDSVFVQRIMGWIQARQLLRLEDSLLRTSAIGLLVPEIGAVNRLNMREPPPGYPAEWYEQIRLPFLARQVLTFRGQDPAVFGREFEIRLPRAAVNPVVYDIARQGQRLRAISGGSQSQSANPESASNRLFAFSSSSSEQRVIGPVEEAGSLAAVSGTSGRSTLGSFRQFNTLDAVSGLTAPPLDSGCPCGSGVGFTPALYVESNLGSGEEVILD